MESGKLVYLTVPIGNLKDISINVLEALKTGEYFYVEDTRSFKNLLKLYEIPLGEKKINSFHDQSSDSVARVIDGLIKDGNNIYYCSEAGSPVISDPGVGLIKSLDSLNENLEVISFGGVCSLITALEVSKVSFSKFTFHGFFPRDGKSRNLVLSQAEMVSKTHLFFESPHRIHKSLKFIFESKSAPDELYVCRELTKKFQEVLRLTKTNYLEKIEEIKSKGEFVLILNYLNSKDLSNSVSDEIYELASSILDGSSKPRTLAKLISKVVDRPVKDVYLALDKNLKKSKN